MRVGGAWWLWREGEAGGRPRGWGEGGQWLWTKGVRWMRRLGWMRLGSTHCGSAQLGPTKTKRHDVYVV